MKEYPILFKPEMICAIQCDRKTQTRRLIELPKWSTGDWEDFDTDGKIAEIICEATGCIDEIPFPYGKIGDILWVRETWQECLGADGKYYLYAADHSESDCHKMKPWKPSIFMPRNACRLKLKIVDIRVERLQDISEEDAIAEGIQRKDGMYKGYLKNSFEWIDDPCLSFQSLWESINGTASWQNSPYVWVINFCKL